MKKIILSFLLSFIINAAYSTSIKINDDPNVNIEILNIVTNGLALPNNTFNFNGLDDLVIEFDVKTTYTGSNIDFNEGHLHCAFYEPNSFDNETAENYNNGVNQIFVFDEIITLLANTNNTYSYTFHKILHFKRKTAYNTGCSLVFRYGTRWTTTNPTILKKITYSFIGGTKTGNESYEPAIANINVTHFSDSNEIPLINNTIIVPDIEDNEIGTRSINLSLNYNCIFGSKLTLGYYPSITIQIKDYMTEEEAADAKYRLESLHQSTQDFDGTKTIAEISKWTNGNDTNGTLTFNDLKIKSSDLSPSSYLNIRFRFQEKDINYKVAIVKSGRPITYNTISDNQSIINGEFTKPFTSQQPTIWTSGGNCTERGCNDPKIYTNITTFQWQKSNIGGNWTNIINATNKEYAEPNILNQTTSYRRIAFFNEGYNISNVVTISINNIPIQNSICCDQNLATSSSQPTAFIGDNTNIAGTYNYQWQIDVNGYIPPIWSNINGATYKDYTHKFSSPAQRGTAKTKFRRLIIQNNVAISNSNEITVNRGSARKIAETKKENINFESGNMNIYPNPATDYFNIQNIKTSTSVDKIKVFDISGKEISINKTILSDNLVQINVSTLPSGIYFVYLDENGLIVKKIIKK